MSKSTILTPFVCKWSDGHLGKQYFSTQEELELHVSNDHKDLTALKDFVQGRKVYMCPWKGCKRPQTDIFNLKEHLRKHTQQKPFKCPICDDLHRFGSLDALNRHLITNHDIIDCTGAKDMTNVTNCNDDTLCDKNEAEQTHRHVTPKISYAQMVKTNIAPVKNKVENLNNWKVNKDEIDTIVKEKADKEDTPLKEDFLTRIGRCEHDFLKSCSEAMEYYEESEESEVGEYDLENENFDDFPLAPKWEGASSLTESEKDDLMWEAYCESHKGSKYVELINKAHKVYKDGIQNIMQTNN